ncbi:MAG: sodium:proton antiporter [Desulfobulbaceae bacterium]|nr:sodium:proton antiporter [Desulfobulbaceae bacterium]
MGLLDIFAILITLAAIFSYLNHCYIGLPSAIGLMVLSLLISLTILALGFFNIFSISEHARLLLSHLDFYDTLMHGMLGLLLFAGALHVNFDDLLEHKSIIISLATVGVALSTFLVGGLTWCVLKLLGMELSILHCFLFGALISPTDPIAVLGIMKKVGAPKSLETAVTGESLFNDGIGVVVFLALLSLLDAQHSPGSSHSITSLFLLEAGGGILYGTGLGLITYWLLKKVDNYQVEVLLTLATVIGGYRLAEVLHISAPLAIVIAGLLVGNHGRRLGMSEETRQHLDTFWELIDEILNSVLFVLIGLEILVLPYDPRYLLVGIILIPVVILSRFISVGSTVSILRKLKDYRQGTVKILTWAGLRGGISVALALSLPVGPEREVLITATYVVMSFSILVQGLTVGKVIKRYLMVPIGS